MHTQPYTSAHSLERSLVHTSVFLHHMCASCCLRSSLLLIQCSIILLGLLLYPTIRKSKTPAPPLLACEWAGESGPGEEAAYTVDHSAGVKSVQIIKHPQDMEAVRTGFQKGAHGLRCLKPVSFKISWW